MSPKTLGAPSQFPGICQYIRDHLFIMGSNFKTPFLKSEFQLFATPLFIKPARIIGFPFQVPNFKRINILRPNIHEKYALQDILSYEVWYVKTPLILLKFMLRPLFNFPNKNPLFRIRRAPVTPPPPPPVVPRHQTRCESMIFRIQ